MIVLTKNLYDQFVAKELTLEQVEEAVDVDPAPAPTPLPQDQYEKETDIATTKLNEVIRSKAADLRFGMSFNHPAVQKLVALEEANEATRREGKDIILEYLNDAGYNVVEDEDDQPEGIPPYEEFKIPAPCFYWLGR